MKKSLLLGGAVVAAALMTGCAGVTTQNGGVALPGGGFYSDSAANAILQPIQDKSYTVVKRGVKAEAKLLGIFAAINMGDASYGTLKAQALSGLKADDLIDVKMDYKQETILGINKVTGHHDRHRHQVQVISLDQRPACAHRSRSFSHM